MAMAASLSDLCPPSKAGVPSRASLTYCDLRPEGSRTEAASVMLGPQVRGRGAASHTCPRASSAGQELSTLGASPCGGGASCSTARVGWDPAMGLPWVPLLCSFSSGLAGAPLEAS